MHESELEDDCIKIAESLGWVTRKMQYIGRRGCRDRDFYKDGHAVFVEFKAPGEKPRPDQRIERKLLSGVGIKIHVIDNEDDFRRLLSESAIKTPSR